MLSSRVTLATASLFARHLVDLPQEASEVFHGTLVASYSSGENRHLPRVLVNVRPCLCSCSRL
jgi:hypothetical protein